MYLTKKIGTQQKYTKIVLFSLEKKTLYTIHHHKQMQCYMLKNTNPIRG
jgi:hypothetical protein